MAGHLMEMTNYNSDDFFIFGILYPCYQKYIRVSQPQKLHSLEKILQEIKSLLSNEKAHESAIEDFSACMENTGNNAG